MYALQLACVDARRDVLTMVYERFIKSWNAGEEQ